MLNRYLSRPVLACFEGEQQPPPPPLPPETPTFTQEAVNQILAADRRKHQAKIETLQKTLEDVSAGKHLPPRAQQAIDEQIESLKAENRTAKEQADHEKAMLEKELTGKITSAEKGRQEADTRYQELLVHSALQGAANKAGVFNPDQFTTIIRQWAKIEPVNDPKTGKPTGAHKVVIDLPDVDEATGEKVVKSLSPEAATKRMKERPSEFGNLFSSGVVSGIGSGSGGGTPGKGGPLDVADVAKRSQSQYMELRQKGLLPWAKPKR
jgi:hypothetical protein